MGTAPPPSPLVLYERLDGVGLLTLNRPDNRNAWSDALGTDYVTALRRADRDQEVRAIVVTGAGRSFCVGGDVGDLQAFAQGRTFDTEQGPRTPAWTTTTVSKPVIAAVNGACAGIGLAQALMCDLRIASADARFTTAYARRGLPAESGMAWILPRLIGTAAAMDLLLSARVVDASEAERLGLVNWVTRDESVVDCALDYARELARNCAPRAMAAIKKQLWESLSATSLAEAARRADLLAEAFLATGDDVMEGVRSFLERRPPNFAPLPADETAGGS